MEIGEDKKDSIAVDSGAGRKGLVEGDFGRYWYWRRAMPDVRSSNVIFSILKSKRKINRIRLQFVFCYL